MCKKNNKKNKVHSCTSCSLKTRSSHNRKVIWSGNYHLWLGASKSWRFSVVVILHTLAYEKPSLVKCSQTSQKQCQGNRSTRTHRQQKRKRNKEMEVIEGREWEHFNWGEVFLVKMDVTKWQREKVAKFTSFIQDASIQAHTTNSNHPSLKVSPSKGDLDANKLVWFFGSLWNVCITLSKTTCFGAGLFKW